MVGFEGRYCSLHSRKSGIICSETMGASFGWSTLVIAGTVLFSFLLRRRPNFRIDTLRLDWWNSSMADYTRQEVFFAKENERPNASTGYMLFLRTIPLLARHRSAHPPTHVHFAAVIFQSHRRHNVIIFPEWRGLRCSLGYVQMS